MLGGLAPALVLAGASRTLWFARTAIFLPVVTVTAVIGEVWRIIYFPSSEGHLNQLLGFVGLGPVGFLQDESRRWVRCSRSARFVTALGWTDGRVSVALRIVLIMVLIYAFAGPIIAIIASAFDLNPDPTRLTPIPTNAGGGVSVLDPGDVLLHA